MIIADYDSDTETFHNNPEVVSINPKIQITSTHVTPNILEVFP